MKLLPRFKMVYSIQHSLFALDKRWLLWYFPCEIIDDRKYRIFGPGTYYGMKTVLMAVMIGKIQYSKNKAFWLVSLKDCTKTIYFDSASDIIKEFPEELI